MGSTSSCSFAIARCSSAWYRLDGTAIASLTLSSEGDPRLGLHAFLWKKGAFRDLGTFDGRSASASDINGAGRIVGGVDPFESLRRGYTHKDGVTTLLPMLPGGRTNEALAINKHGDIVGWSEGARLRVNRPTLWIKQ